MRRVLPFHGPIPECAWGRAAKSATAQIPLLSRRGVSTPWGTSLWKIAPSEPMAGGTLVQARDRTRQALRTKRACATRHRRGEPCLCRQILPRILRQIRPSAIMTQENPRPPTTGGGDDSPIRLPRSVGAVRRCPDPRKALRPPEQHPGFPGQKIRQGRDLLDQALLETTKAGGIPRHSRVARRIRLVSPETRVARVGSRKIHRAAATLGRR